MASALAKQLSQIAATSTNSLNLKAQKSAHAQSLIFESKVAATQNFDTIYQICQEGYRELCLLDPRFVKFARTVFGEQSRTRDRNQMTARENKELDNVIEDFLGLAGGRLLLKPAIKAVEWLVRRFRVHEHNTSVLILTFLPYHTSPIFLSLLSILPSNLPPTFKVFHPYVRSVTTPARHSIVYTTIHNQSFLAAFNAHVLKVSKARHHHRALISFWAGIMAEAVASMIDLVRSGRKGLQKQGEQDVLLRILPVLSEGLVMKQVSDLRVGCYLILIVLATKAILEDKVLTSMIEAVIVGWRSETCRSGLICLALLAQKRSTLKLPKAVFKAIMEVSALEEELKSLHGLYKVDRLLFALLLEVINNLNKSEGIENLPFLERLLEAQILTKHQTGLICESIIQLARHARTTETRSPDLRNQLGDAFVRLTKSTAVGTMMWEKLKDSRLDVDLLEMALHTTIAPKDVSASEEAVDDGMSSPANNLTTQTFENAVLNLPSRTADEVSFLSPKRSYLFSSLSHTFQLAASSLTDLAKFADLPILRKDSALEEPLFISFFVRVWCGSCPVLVRSAALRVVALYLSDLPDPSINLQALLPYLISALADASRNIRSAAAEVVVAIGNIHKHMEPKREKNNQEMEVWACDNLYGPTQRVKAVEWLSTVETLRVLEQALLPSLEECILDHNYVGRVFESALGRSSYQSHAHPRTNTVELKTSIRVALLTFLGGHIESTPLFVVKLKLLTMLNRTAKVGSTSRTKVLMPVLRHWVSTTRDELVDRCDNEQVDFNELEKQVIDIVLPTDNQGLQALQTIVEPKTCLERPSLVKTVLIRYHKIWSSLKAEAMFTLAQLLFTFCFETTSDHYTQNCQGDAMELLRSVKLTTDVLQYFIGQLPAAAEMRDVAPAIKRRRIHSNKNLTLIDSESLVLTAAIRKYTFVLEVVDKSGPEAHPQLLKGLFHVLSELQDLKALMGSELAYLQELVLGSLLGMVEGRRTAGFDHSAVRADLLVDCARTTISPQVQNAALLLVASLAKLTPELVLHSVIPMFTFMGATMLKQNDEYSAHVIEHTIHQVVPPLVQSLRQKNCDIVSGVSGLLLSFVAAFEHVPTHRRSKLYISLIKVLGPEEFLFALLALLADKYSGDVKAQDFAIALAREFSVDVQLTSTSKYLDLIADTLQPKRGLSASLFQIDEKNSHSIQDVALNLLHLLRKLLAQPRLKSLLGKTLQQDHRDALRPRQLFSTILEKLLGLAETVRNDSRLHECCGNTLTSLLGLLTLTEFLKSIVSLLDRPDNGLRRKILNSFSIRMNVENQADKITYEIIVELLRRLCHIIEDSSDTSLTHVAIVSADLISEKYGKKITQEIISTAAVIAGSKVLGSNDSRIRIIALLCLASMIDVIGEGIISFLPQALTNALQHLKDSISEADENEALHNAVYSFLSAVLSHVPWIIEGAFLDRILQLSYESATVDLGVDADESRANVLQLIARQVNAREAFHALERTWVNATAEGPFAAKDYLRVLNTVIEKHKKSVIVTNSQTLANILINGFDLRRVRSAEAYDDEDINEIENIITDVAIKIIYKMNDSTFRPLFMKLLEWATSSLGKHDRVGRMLRLTSLYNFFFKFFDTLKSIVTTYSGCLIDNAVQIISEASWKDPNYITLWTSTMRTLLKAFEHDQDDFWQLPSHFNAISSPLIDQLAHAYSPSISSEVIPAITELAAAADSADHRKEINAAILKHLRSEDAQVRLAAVKCEESLAERLGEEWLALLPEMLPLISELQEDDDEDVENETHRWIVKIEAILGENLDAMLQ